VIELVPASPAHVGRIANRIRDIDRREAEAFGHSPKTALRLGIRASVLAWTAMLDGSPQAMFGVRPMSSIEGRGMAWFLATDAAFGCARDLLSIGPAVIEAMHRRFTGWRIGSHRKRRGDTNARAMGLRARGADDDGSRRRVPAILEGRSRFVIRSAFTSPQPPSWRSARACRAISTANQYRYEARVAKANTIAEDARAGCDRARTAALILDYQRQLAQRDGPAERRTGGQRYRSDVRLRGMRLRADTAQFGRADVNRINENAIREAKGYEINAANYSAEAISDRRKASGALVRAHSGSPPPSLAARRRSPRCGGYGTGYGG
jgi:hypothetical protein